jgi:NTP pyrophosphatase (non-canonical NTP hydrolase)
MSENLNIQKISLDLQKFADDRDWQKFHTPKNLAISIAIEASELLQLFQWSRGQTDWLELKDEKLKHKVEDEIADILLYLIRFADLANLDLETIVLNKIHVNSTRYAVDKFKGTDKKYNE